MKDIYHETLRQEIINGNNIVNHEGFSVKIVQKINSSLNNLILATDHASRFA